MNIVDVEGSDDGGIVDFDGGTDAGLAFVEAREVNRNGAVGDDAVDFTSGGGERVLEFKINKKGKRKNDLRRM